MNNMEEKSEFEELSAWLDNEDCTFSEEQKNSTENKQIAKDFRAIDSAIAKLSAAPQASPDLAARIAARCNSSKSAPIPFARNLYRIAAIAAACLIVTFIFKNEQTKDETLSQAGENQPKTAVVPVLSAAAENKNSGNFDEALRTNPSPATPSGDFNLVGTNQSVPQTANLVVLDENVKHVWVCDNTLQAVQLLRKLSDKVNDMETLIDPKGNIEVTLLLSDSEIVKLVDDLSRNGLDLVSKQFPQPQSDASVSTTGKLIRYNISFIRKN